MRKIASFTIDHTNLKSGIYVSMRQRYNNTIITTFDIRIRTPYIDPVMTISEMHTIEHIGASYLRNHSIIGDSIVYFGPMGCRTGFYLVMEGDVNSEEIVPIIRSLFTHIANFTGPIPGASKKECGNYTDMDLLSAKNTARIYLEQTLNKLSLDQLYYQNKL